MFCECHASVVTCSIVIVCFVSINIKIINLKLKVVLHRKFKKYDIRELDFGTVNFGISILVLAWNLALLSYYGDKK